MSTVQLAVVDGKTITQATELQSGKAAGPVKVRAIKGGKFILADTKTGHAPENITIKRVGKNLLVSLEGDDLEHPSLIIEEFYGNEGQLVGLGEDGAYHEYIASDAQDDHEAAFLADGADSPLVLGAQNLEGFGGDLVAAPAAGAIGWAALGMFGLAAAGLVGAAVIGGGRDSNNGNNGGDNGGGNGGDNGGGQGPDPANGDHLLPTIEQLIDDVGSIQGPIAQGGFTDDNHPTIIGRGTAPGNKIEILDNGQKIGEAIVKADGTWEYTPTTALQDGSHQITVVETEAETGLVGKPSAGFDFIVDTVAPALPDFEVIDQGGNPITDGHPTNETNPVFRGENGEPGNTVIIRDPDTGEVVGSTIVDPGGNWEIPVDTGGVEGDHHYEVIITDPAGNESSADFDLIVDTTAPDAPTLDLVYDDVGTVQGPLRSGDTTDDARPTVSGTAEAHSVVYVYNGGTLLGSTQTNAAGKWEWEPTVDLDNGAYHLTARAHDAAGNISDPSNAFDFNLITGGTPSAPAITGVVDNVGSIQGPLQPGDVTDDTTPTVTGTAVPGVVVTLYADGAAVGSRLVGADGQWSIEPSPALSEGRHELTAIARNAAGNPSPETGAFPIIVDTTAPGALDASELKLIDDVGPIQGEIHSGDQTDDANPTFSGKGDAGDTIIIRDNGTIIGSTVVTGSGDWSWEPETALPDGDHALSAQPVDRAGNAGPITTPIDFTVDTRNVDISLTQVLDDVGVYQGPIANHGVTDDTTPTASGRGTPGGIVRIYDSVGGTKTLLGSTTVDASGHWSFPTPVLAEGQHSLTATVQTPATGESAPTSAWDFTVDTTAPDAGSIGPILDDVGAIQGPIPIVDGRGVTDDTTPTLTGGGLTPGDTVLIRDGDQVIGTTIVDPSGNWSYTPTNPLNEGDHEFSIVVRDPAGNESAASTPVIVEVDTTPPADVAFEVVDGNGNPIGNGGATNETNPVFRGDDADPGDTIVIRDKDTGEVVGTTIVGPDGHWEIPVDTGDAEGERHYEVIAEDPAGNTSNPVERDLIIDMTAPDAPTLDLVYDDVGTVQGPLRSGDTTDDARPTVSGTAEAHSVVYVYNGGTLLGSTQTNAAGKWEWEPTVDLDNGAYHLTARAHDAAGNISDPSNAFDFNLITGGTPSTPTITRAVDNVPGGVVGDLANNAWTNDNTPELHGKADPNSTVYIYDGSAFLGTVVASTSGDWVYTTPSRSDGKHDFTAVVKDAAGNESAASAKWTLYVDTVIATPTITSLYDNVGVDQGYVGNNGSTDDNTPTLSGSAEAGSTVYFYDGSRLLGTTIAATNGSWTYTTPALGLGAHHFKVTAIDRAGNSATSTDWSVNIINPAPTSVYENFESISGNAYLMNAGNSVSTANVDVRALSSGQETGIADFKQGVLERRNNGGPVEPVNPTSGKSLAVIKNGVIQVSLRNNLQATTFSALVGDLTEREQFHIKFYDAYGNFITSSDHYAGGPSSFSVNVTMPGGKSFSYFTVSTSSDASWVWIDNLNFTGLSYKTGSLSMSSMMAAEATGSDDATLGALEEGNPVVSNHASHPVSGEPNSENTGEHNGKVEATKEDSSPSSESEFVLTESNAATFEAHGSVDAIDTLKLTGADQVLDFSTLNGKVTSVEVIDITGTGDNTLKLSLGDVLEQGGKDLFIADGKTQMMVKGNAGDTVELSDLMPDGTDMGDWAQQNGTVTVEGSQYNVFVHEGLNTELLVQIGVQTNLDNH